MLQVNAFVKDHLRGADLILAQIATANRISLR